MRGVPFGFFFLHEHQSPKMSVHGTASFPAPYIMLYRRQRFDLMTFSVSYWHKRCYPAMLQTDTARQCITPPRKVSFGIRCLKSLTQQWYLTTSDWEWADCAQRLLSTFTQMLFRYNFDILVLYLSISTFCYFIVLPGFQQNFKMSPRLLKDTEIFYSFLSHLPGVSNISDPNSIQT